MPTPYQLIDRSVHIRSGRDTYRLRRLIWASAVPICFLLKTVLKVPPIIGMIVGAVVCFVTGLVFMRRLAISDSDKEILGGVRHGRGATVPRWIGMLPSVSEGWGGHRYAHTVHGKGVCYNQLITG
jgi:hypothetical protein